MALKDFALRASIILGSFFIGAAMVLLAYAITAPHTVRQYYVGRPSTANGYSSANGYCIMSSIDWDVDTAVFCSDDITKIVDEVNKLNETLKTK